MVKDKPAAHLDGSHSHNQKVAGSNHISYANKCIEM